MSQEKTMNQTSFYFIIFLLKIVNKYYYGKYVLSNS